MTPIELNNFSIHLGKRITLKKCNFSIAEGSSTVIMGPTGTGKSVFLKSIGGILSTQIFTFEGSMLLTQTDLPLPVEPAIRRCGVFTKSIICVSP